MKKRTLTLVLALVLCLGFTAGALAASGTRTIEVTYRDIKLVVDGAEVTLKDGAGNSIEPFIYNGTTYLPVRAVGEALGKEVLWDGNSSTVYVGKIPGQEEVVPPYQVGGSNDTKFYDGSDPKSYFTVSGVNHTVGLTMSGPSGDNDAYALWNTNAQYSSMSFTIGNLDGWKRDGTLDVYLDGKLANSFDLKWDNPPQTISIPLNYAASVKLSLPGGFVVDWPTYGIYDISFS